MWAWPLMSTNVTSVSPVRHPIRWRNHSRATKIGQRMWNRNALCSNGVPCRSRIRKRIRPSSESSSSVLRRANETRARVGDREVVGEHSVEAHEAVIEDIDCVFG